MTKVKEKKNNFVWGVLAGGLLASAASLLLAAKSGRELRGDIAEGAKKASDAAGKFAGKAKGAADTVINSVKEWRDKSGKAETSEEITVVDKAAAISDETDATESGSTDSKDKETPGI
ncbi:YtxH domain-containing protein [Paenibacillus beijingensis]|uniref:YtxH domain-containing protein n=1 Tax=Paenibacillus beijingensis TaxID=1126833 RepID=UPI000696BD70|nr:YtxH domain-containing protein [Paenibacillus beijingensis]